MLIMNIQDKSRHIRGQEYPGRIAQGQNVEIVPDKFVRLFGIDSNNVAPKPHDITFKVGDKAEYDSYNLKYIGTITAIKAKYIEIQEPYRSGKRHRLCLYEFNFRNNDFDLPKINKENAEESMCI